MLIKVSNLKKNFKVKVKEKGFKKSYKVVKAVEGIDFFVEKGEMVAFIGPNGAGKSTTIKMLTGIIKPSSGEILIDGLNPNEDRNKLTYKIGCMFGQKSQLYLHLSVLDSFYLIGSIYNMDKVTIQQRIKEVSKTFEIENLLSLTVRKLSLGQRMICEIAGSMLHEPEILFLDEPTIGLDIVAKEKIRNVINNLNKQSNTTVFLTSHDISDIEALCNRVIIINNGKIIKDCSMKDLKKEFLKERILNISYESGEELTVKVDTKKQNISNVISSCIENGEIKDIKIQEISLEEVIGNIYKGGKQNE